MNAFTIRFTAGVTPHSIYYESTQKTIFRSKYGDDSVAPYDLQGWYFFNGVRIKLYRSQKDPTLWLDYKEFLLEREGLLTEEGLYALGKSYWPSTSLIVSLGLQSYTPARNVSVEFKDDMVWTTTLKRKSKV